MDEERMLQILRGKGVLRRGHFKLSNGIHGSTFLDPAALFVDPVVARELCEALACEFEEDKPHVVLSATPTGAMLAHGVALWLEARRAITAHRLGHLVDLPPFAEIQRGENVLIVGDVAVRGGLIRHLLNIVTERHAIPVGVGLIVALGGEAASFPVKTNILLSSRESLARLKIQIYELESCPLCQVDFPLEIAPALITQGLP